MKKLLILTLCGVALLNMVACGANDATLAAASFNSDNPIAFDVAESSIDESNAKFDKTKAENVVNALFSAGFLGQQGWPTSDLEVLKNDLAFTTFFCFMNPDYAYPAEIPASEYEPFINGYFDIPNDFLHKIDDYNVANNSYKVSVDISVDMLTMQIHDYFRIDSIEQKNGMIKVSYRILWRNMAGSGDGSDSAFEGYVLLDNDENYYRIQSTTVTADNSNKYD